MVVVVVSTSTSGLRQARLQVHLYVGLLWSIIVTLSCDYPNGIVNVDSCEKM